MSDRAKGNRVKARRIAGGALALLGAFGLAAILRGATDFPTDDPHARVDAALVARCRENPGLHLALAPDFEIDVELDLRDDPWNRAFYGTDLELREAVARRAIHIQRKDGRTAIHADDYNPKAGAFSQLVHGTIDIPVIPLALGLALGLGMVVKPGPSRE